MANCTAKKIDNAHEVIYISGDPSVANCRASPCSPDDVRERDLAQVAEARPCWTKMMEENVIKQRRGDDAILRSHSPLRRSSQTWPDLGHDFRFLFVITEDSSPTTSQDDTLFLTCGVCSGHRPCDSSLNPDQLRHNVPIHVCLRCQCPRGSLHAAEATYV
jgi:hypothetical protein